MSTRRSRASAGRWLADRPIALKPASVMVVLALVAVGVSAVSLRGTRGLEAAGQQMQREHVQPLVTLAAIQDAFQSDRVRVVTYEVPDEAAAARLRRELAGHRESVEGLLASYQGHEADDKAWPRTVQSLESYDTSVDGRLAVEPPGPTDPSRESRLAGSVLSPLSVEHDAQARAARVLAADGDDLARRVTLQVVLALLVGLALSVARPIRQRLRAVRETATALAAGDLMRGTGVECGDEVGATAAAQTSEQSTGAAGAAGEAVVEVITSIAEQTDLLALNATIEAARATEDIAAKVAAIRSDTSAAVAAIGEISAIIARVDDHQTTIAPAVEEQTATTAEMSRSAGEAAAGSGQIAAVVEQVASAVEATTAALGRTRDVVANLNGQARTLEEQVAGFRR